ncbi:MAG: 30S ribosomal protein S9 [Planctomycetota bacterium]|nr:30S ribosomal protein S9 [Planctomycetota bacterium]
MTVATPFTWGLGRRKSSVARVRIRPGTGNFLVNGKSVDEYFTTLRDQKQAKAALEVGEGTGETYDIWCNVNGGGPHGQAGAVQLGLARALKEVNPVLMEALREDGLLTRDPRMKERKKYGRRGARRGFQWCKR